MAKPRLSLEAVVDTLAHAQTLRVDLQAELVGKDTFQNHRLGVSKDEEGLIKLQLDIRFNPGTDRDTVRDWIRDEIRDNPAVSDWVSWARVVWHECVHDGSYDREVTDDEGTRTIRPDTCSIADRDKLEWGSLA